MGSNARGRSAPGPAARSAWHARGFRDSRSSAPVPGPRPPAGPARRSGARTGIPTGIRAILVALSESYPRPAMGGPPSELASTVVMKFGGTSVANADRIRSAAQRIVNAKEAGQRVVAVLSARGKTTDELISMAYEVCARPDPREMDMLLSTGERISCALAAMVINELGHYAESLTGSQAGVLQLRSVEYARNHGVRIHCRSSFDDGPGTFVLTEDETMERPLVTAVTHSTEDARVTLTQLPDRPGVAGRVLSALAEANVNVDMIIQNEPESEGRSADMSFTVPREDLEAARTALQPLVGELGMGEIATDPGMGKVSLVGAGMRTHPGVAAKTFTVLGEAGVNIEMISTSPIKISCVVREDDVPTAVRELHRAFGLGENGVRREDPRGPDHRPRA